MFKLSPRLIQILFECNSSSVVISPPAFVRLSSAYSGWFWAEQKTEKNRAPEQVNMRQQVRDNYSRRCCSTRPWSSSLFLLIPPHEVPLSPSYSHSFSPSLLHSHLPRNPPWSFTHLFALSHCAPLSLYIYNTLLFFLKLKPRGKQFKQGSFQILSRTLNS